jgi:hypothetical protein
MRAATLVDAKSFEQALGDYDRALKLTGREPTIPPGSARCSRRRATCVRLCSQQLPHRDGQACAPPGAEEQLDVARLLAGRALAYEGLSDWRCALRDYDAALGTASAAGKKPDPYVLNSRGNCHNSLGEWDGARPGSWAPACPCAALPEGCSMPWVRPQLGPAGPWHSHPRLQGWRHTHPPASSAACPHAPHLPNPTPPP